MKYEASDIHAVLVHVLMQVDWQKYEWVERHRARIATTHCIQEDLSDARDCTRNIEPHWLGLLRYLFRRIICSASQSQRAFVCVRP